MSLITLSAMLLPSGVVSPPATVGNCGEQEDEHHAFMFPFKWPIKRHWWMSQPSWDYTWDRSTCIARFPRMCLHLSRLRPSIWPHKESPCTALCFCAVKVFSSGSDIVCNSHVAEWVWCWYKGDTWTMCSSWLQTLKFSYSHITMPLFFFSSH